MGVFKFFAPKCTLFGYGCLEGLGEEIRSAGYRRALIMTDQTLVQAGIVKRVTDILEKYQISFFIFDAVKPNPDFRNVDQGLLSAKENAELLIEKIEKISSAIGTKVCLKALGVKKEDIGRLAQKALLDGSLGNNGIQPSREQIETIYQTLMEEERL